MTVFEFVFFFFDITVEFITLIVEFIKVRHPWHCMLDAYMRL